MNAKQFVEQFNQLLAEANQAGLDHEELLARVYAEHMTSDEKCDKCHIYGITFGQKLNRLMLEEMGYVRADPGTGSALEDGAQS